MKPNAIYTGDIVRTLWMGPVSDRSKDAPMPQMKNTEVRTPNVSFVDAA